MSLPRPPWIRSAPGPPQSRSLPRLPRMMSSPPPPQITSRPGVPVSLSGPSVPTMSACLPWQRGVGSSGAAVSAPVPAPAAGLVAASAQPTAIPLIRGFTGCKKPPGPDGCGPLRAASEPSSAANQLLVDELVGPGGAQLAAEAGALDAAERQLGAVGEDEVDVDHPGFDLVRDPLRLILVGAHHVGPQPERDLVRELDRLLLRADPVDLRHRPEELFLGGLVAGLDPSENRRLDVVPVAPAADDHLGAVFDRPLQLVLERVRRGCRG